MLRDRLVSPLGGLMVSRDRRGYAVTSTPEGQAWHRHGDCVVNDPSISAPYPPEPLRGPGCRATDRTCNGWLGIMLLC